MMDIIFPLETCRVCGHTGTLGFVAVLGAKGAYCQHGCAQRAAQGVYAQQRERDRLMLEGFRTGASMTIRMPDLYDPLSGVIDTGITFSERATAEAMAQDHLEPTKPTLMQRLKTLFHFKVPA